MGLHPPDPSRNDKNCKEIELIAKEAFVYLHGGKYEDDNFTNLKFRWKDYFKTDDHIRTVYDYVSIYVEKPLLSEIDIDEAKTLDISKLSFYVKREKRSSVNPEMVNDDVAGIAKEAFVYLYGGKNKDEGSANIDQWKRNLDSRWKACFNTNDGIEQFYNYVSIWAKWPRWSNITIDEAKKLDISNLSFRGYELPPRGGGGKGGGFLGTAPPPPANCNQKGRPQGGHHRWGRERREREQDSQIHSSLRFETRRTPCEGNASQSSFHISFHLSLESGRVRLLFFIV